MPTIIQQITDAINHGKAVEIKYTVGADSRVCQVIPYLIGTSPPGTQNRTLCYQYVGRPPVPAWRCFAVDKITTVIRVFDVPQNVPRPLPVVDEGRQNCVKTINARRP
jgi:hypothetical protein